MINDFIDIKCEGDVELFAATATRWITEKKTATVTLRVPNDWWINYAMSVFIDASKTLDIPETEDPYVDVMFDVVDTRMFRELDEINNLSDEEIQDLIDEFLDTLDDFGNEDDDPMEDNDQ